MEIFVIQCMNLKMILNLKNYNFMDSKFVDNILQSCDCNELNNLINIINNELNFRKENKQELTFDDVVKHIANTSEAFKGDINLCNAFLHTLLVTNTYVFISLMMKAIAVLLDQKYPDHIRNCEKGYVFNLGVGHIVEMNVSVIPYIQAVAVFRTLEDAKLACKILRPVLKETYRYGKQKNKKC